MKKVLLGLALLLAGCAVPPPEPRPEGFAPMEEQPLYLLVPQIEQVGKYSYVYHKLVYVPPDVRSTQAFEALVKRLAH